MRIRRKKKRAIDKYRFVTDYELSFPDIKKAFKTFGHILENDEEMKEVFPYGVKHFQVSKKRSSKNIKEILAPSTVALSRPLTMNTNDDTESPGSHPCNKPCVYCKLLSKTETGHFTSVSTGQSYKIRQSINCQSKSVIYVVKCVKCNLQGVGQQKFSKRISNYFSHIKQKRRTCTIRNHCIDHHMDECKGNYKDNNLFQIAGIAILTNLPSNEQLKSKRLEEFEGYWQLKLVTIYPHGLNSINELKECYQRFLTKF